MTPRGHALLRTMRDAEGRLVGPDFDPSTRALLATLQRQGLVAPERDGIHERPRAYTLTATGWEASRGEP